MFWLFSFFPSFVLGSSQSWGRQSRLDSAGEVWRWSGGGLIVACVWVCVCSWFSDTVFLFLLFLFLGGWMMGGCYGDNFLLLLCVSMCQCASLCVLCLCVWFVCSYSWLLLSCSRRHPQTARNQIAKNVPSICTPPPCANATSFKCIPPPHIFSPYHQPPP